MSAMTAGELLERLQRHYIAPGTPMPGGAFLPEVTHGRAGGRRADAIYVGFFSSRGRFAVGHEIKVSRADWLHELDQAEKAEVWATECHAWYVVAPSIEVVHPNELPHGWGLMLPGRSKTQMQIVVKAKVHEDRQPSWEATHAIVQRMDSLRMRAESKAIEKADHVVSMVSSALRVKHDGGIDVRVKRIVDKAQKLGAEPDIDLLRSRLEQEKEKVRSLCEILGVELVHENTWHRPGNPNIDEVRTSFAAWLAADVAVDDALGHRRALITDSVEKLKGALDLLDAAQQALDLP